MLTAFAQLPPFAACMLTVPPIICSNFCLNIPNLYAPACSRPSPNLPPLPTACSRHRLSFVPTFVCTSPIYMRLHAHGLRPPHHIYAACMLTALAQLPTSISPACSRHTARHWPLQHRLRMHSTRTHHPTTPQHYTNLPPARHSTAPTTVAPASPITYRLDRHLLSSYRLPFTNLSLPHRKHSTQQHTYLATSLTSISLQPQQPQLYHLHQ